LWMTRGPFVFQSDLQSHHKEPEIIVASASFRFHERIAEYYNNRRITRDIHIYSIPVEYAKQVRTHLKANGLFELISWLEQSLKMHETWKQGCHGISIYYCKSSDTIRIEE